MPFKWSLTPSIRDKILKRTGVKGVWTRNLAITVILVTLSLVCILVLLRLSTKYLEEDINRSLQHGVEQRQINIDFITVIGFTYICLHHVLCMFSIQCLIDIRK